MFGRDPNWSRGWMYAQQASRHQDGFVRAAAALLIPVLAYAYSPVLGLVLAVPFGIAFLWCVRQGIHRFTRGGR